MIFDYQFRNYNFRALIYMILLSVLGILVVGSASNQDRSSVIKQIIGVVVSLIICLVLSLIDYHQYFRFTTLIYVVCAGMLAAVLLFGRTTKGATRWLRIGGIQIQPSEFVKIGLILILANFLSRNRDKINEPKTLGMTALICALPVGMVYLQPNLSTTIVICFMILCMVYVAGISYKWIAGAVAVGVPGFAALIYLSLQGFIPFLQKYQAQRIMGKIFHSSSEFTDLNRQQDNSMMAIGSGQLAAAGAFCTRQVKNKKQAAPWKGGGKRHCLLYRNP